jgi:hypothetical protein
MATTVIKISDIYGSTARELHSEALREGRSDSSMGLIRLRESLLRRRADRAAAKELVEALRAPGQTSVR